MSNGKPHTHQPELRRRTYTIPVPDWVLEYGDTTIRVCGWGRTPTPKDVNRAFLKAIKKHDDASRKVAKVDTSVEAAKAEMNRLFEMTGSEKSAYYGYQSTPAVWASEKVKAK